MASQKLESPSAERNKLPIWNQVFVSHLLTNDNFEQATSTENPVQVLEVAAGCGVHTQFFAQQLAERQIPVLWQSTDPEASALASQEAYIEEISKNPSLTKDDDWKRTCGTVQFAKPRFLTLQANGVQEECTDAAIAPASIDWIWNINMIHISPWSATLGLMKVAGQKLKPDSGRLLLYGPFRVNGTMVESNMYDYRCIEVTTCISLSS